MIPPNPIRLTELLLSQRPRLIERWLEERGYNRTATHATHWTWMGIGCDLAFLAAMPVAALEDVLRRCGHIPSHFSDTARDWWPRYEIGGSRYIVSSHYQVP